MNITHRHAIGGSVQEVDTPALLLDWPACERNLRRMADFFCNRPCQLRPHFKNHKCTTLARKQLEAGSCVGITCARLGEAQILVEHGIDDVLIANQVGGDRKLKRLAEIARYANVSVAVDDIDNIKAISSAAEAAGSTVAVLIEVDIGMARCGVQPGKPAIELARKIQGLGGIKFEGIQSYEGHTPQIENFAERSRQACGAMELSFQTRALMEENGFAVNRISGGASANYQIVGVLDGLDELQGGTYATMDWTYQQVIPEFEIALSVLASVISRPAAGIVVLDVGVKGLGSEFGKPRVKEYPDAQIKGFGSEEHLVLADVPDWRVGQTLQLIPSHACTTCNHYRELVIHEAGRVADVWPIEASAGLA